MKATQMKVAEKSEQTSPDDTTDQRMQRIAATAYFRAEQRGFAPGHEMEDWLAAEAEVDGAAAGKLH